MLADRINIEYFDWLVNLVCADRYSNHISYRKLLGYLHDMEFRYSIPRDSNRAEDGVDLRYRFTYLTGNDDFAMYLDDGPCSILEMMIALAIRCEEDIMDNTAVGDRIPQWFWGMVVNLGLGGETDDRFNEEYVECILNRFLNREYDPDGKGGLFRIRNCEEDLRDVEIWCQLCWYLGTIV